MSKPTIFVTHTSGISISLLLFLFSIQTTSAQALEICKDSSDKPNGIFVGVGSQTNVFTGKLSKRFARNASMPTVFFGTNLSYFELRASIGFGNSYVLNDFTSEGDWKKGTPVNVSAFSGFIGYRFPFRQIVFIPMAFGAGNHYSAKDNQPDEVYATGTLAWGGGIEYVLNRSKTQDRERVSLFIRTEVFFSVDDKGGIFSALVYLGCRFNHSDDERNKLLQGTNGLLGGCLASSW